MHLVTLARGLAKLVVPSKLYGAMAAARPIAYVGPEDGEVGRVVSQHDIGWCIAPGDAAQLAQIISQAEDGSHDLDARGQRAREHMLAEFERKTATTAFRKLLSEAASVSCSAA
jgi:glycosyltransferase involved in cell wall biosynthesis